jgi:hypothetical protein
MGRPMPILIPPAWADDHDKATTVRTAPRNKTAFAFMADSPAKNPSNQSGYI